MNTDSREYHILVNAIVKVKNVEGLTCEIGVREGGSSHLILKTLKSTNQSKVHVAIDPFGNIDYTFYESSVVKLDYTNHMKNNMLKNLYAYCAETGMECLFFPLEDNEFFERYKDGVPIYNERKRIVNSYALVFLDGPHASAIVKTEFDFFKSRIPVGGMIVFDDIDQYPHMVKLHEYIESCGFKLVENGVCKASYIKVADASNNAA